LDHDITDYDYSPSELVELVNNIFNAATGYNIDPKHLIKNIQKAMLDTLRQLSSYSIQVVGEINDQPITILNWAAVRTGDMESISSDTLYLPVWTEILDAAGESDDTRDFDLDSFRVFEVAEAYSHENTDMVLDTHLDLTVDTVRDIGGGLSLGDYTMTSEYPGRDEKVMQKYGIIGMEGFLALTEEQKRSIPDLYQNINFL
jgi:hypothetical protein